MTVSEWVRQALRTARRSEPRSTVSKKLAVIEAATEYEFPTADVEQMIDEIDAGYRAGGEQ